MVTYSSHRLIMGKVEIDNLSSVLLEIFDFFAQTFTELTVSAVSLEIFDFFLTDMLIE